MEMDVIVRGLTGGRSGNLDAVTSNEMETGVDSLERKSRQMVSEWNEMNLRIDIDKEIIRNLFPPRKKRYPGKSCV